MRRDITALLGLPDYGVAGQIGLESDYRTYVATMVEVFRAVRHVLREDGTLWLNIYLLAAPFSLSSSLALSLAALIVYGAMDGVSVVVCHGEGGASGADGAADDGGEAGGGGGAVLASTSGMVHSI